MKHYDAACKLAADEQGITSIVDALTAAGIKVEVHQTGGFCMVAYVYDSDDHDESAPRIGITWECIVFYQDEDNNPEGEMLYENENDVTDAYLETVVNVVKANLPRIKPMNEEEILEFFVTTVEELAAMFLIKDIANFKTEVGAALGPDSYKKFLMAIHTWLDDEMQREGL